MIQDRSTRVLSPRGCNASGNPLCFVSDRVGGVWKPQPLGTGEAVGDYGEGGEVAVPEGRAMVQAGTRDELTTCATQKKSRPTYVVRGGTVQESPSFAMWLAKRPFLGVFPASLLRSAQPRSHRSEVFQPPLTRARGKQQQEVQPWRPAAPHNLGDAWEVFRSPDRAPLRHQSKRASRSRPATSSTR